MALASFEQLVNDLEHRLRDRIGWLDAVGAEVNARVLDHVNQARTETGLARRSAPWWKGCPVLFCDEFLAASELVELRRYVRSQRDAFAPASLVNGESSQVFVDRLFRSSETLFDIGPFRALFESRISYYLDFMCARLNCPPFDQPTFEIQLTATRNGGFFKPHDDNSHPGNKTRRLTFVFYFFIENIRWKGGALRFGRSEDCPHPFDVSPVENRLVFFDSKRRHEVLPYRSESDAFEASRFTLNGWVHQGTWP